jgi:hypothetical protein
MSLSDLASIGNLVSGIAVLVSLLYLAQQTRQNAKHTRALIHQGRADQWIDFSLRWAEDASLAKIVLDGDSADPALDALGLFRYSSNSIAAFALFEDLFHQHRDNLIDEERHLAMLKTLRLRLTAPGFRVCWEQTRDMYAPAFQKFMDDAVREAGATAAPNLEDRLAAFKSRVAELSTSGT